MIKQKIKEVMLAALSELKITVPDLHLEHPADESHGDYSTNIALIIFSKQKNSEYSSPRQLAEDLVAEINLEKEPLLQKVEVAGAGFINFWLSESALLHQLELIFDKKYPLPDYSAKPPVIVEYSSPNIAKPFTIGHLRSSIIGDAVANLYDFLGYQVYRDNHLGDWGTQFGKQILAIKKWGNEEAIESADNPVKELVALYVKFHQEAEQDPDLIIQAREWFKKLEDGDAEARRLWKKCIDWSWKEFKYLYEQLGINFTENDGRGYGESYFEDWMPGVIEELEHKGLLTDSEGAKLVFFPDDKYPPLMILKKDGSTLYATRDLATDKFRLQKYGSEVVIINEVGAEQSLYFQQLFAVEEMLQWVNPGQRVHVGHGLYRFKNKKMSTRQGNVIWLRDVLAEAHSRALQLVGGDHVLAQAVGIGALKYNDLKRKPHLNIVFDWDEILSMDGNSGPYLQYTYARAQSVLQKGQEQGLEPLISSDSWNEKEEKILRYIYRFSEVVVAAAEANSPHLLAAFLYEMAQMYNSFYNNYTILGSAKETVTAERSQFRLALTKSVANILETGLQLLGIQAPVKM